jgi:rhodanese-related sulfurtransferase
MTVRSSVAVAFVLSLPLFTTGPALAATPSIYQSVLVEPNQKTEEVSTEQVRAIVADGSAILLDSRPRQEFVNGHLPGARFLDGPASAHVAAAEALVGGDKSKALVLYCNGPFCQASRRLADQLVEAGFTNVRRYQLGIPVWRALGGPTAIELEGVMRVIKFDRTAVFFDARSSGQFAQGTISGAQNIPPEKQSPLKMQGIKMPEDDFNTRIILFGEDGDQAHALAEAFSKRPWHNVMYFTGSYDDLAPAIAQKR